MTEYTADIGDKICLRIGMGKSLVKICKELHIKYYQVFEWLKENEEFSNNYTCAREAQADFHADEIIDIADTEPDANKARVRIDARKWVAGKMKPKKYGDSTQIKHADANGDKLSMADILGSLDGRTADLPSDKG